MRITSLVNTSACALLLGSCLCHAQDGDALKLWYRQPAGAWTLALSVGNGRLAAMVFGTVGKQHIQLNEDTTWSGEKRDRSNPDVHVLLPPPGSRIREIREGRQSSRLQPRTGSSASLPVKAGHIYTIQFERGDG